MPSTRRDQSLAAGPTQDIPENIPRLQSSYNTTEGKVERVGCLTRTASGGRLQHCRAQAPAHRDKGHHREKGGERSYDSRVVRYSNLPA